MEIWLVDHRPGQLAGAGGSTRSRPSHYNRRSRPDASWHCSTTVCYG